MKDVLTLEQMARRTGEPEERLRHWRSLGLIGAEESERFRAEDVERTRLVQSFLRRGIGLEMIVRAAESGVLDRYVDYMPPAGSASGYSLAEVAEMIGLDIDLTRRLWEAAEVGERGEVCDEEDVSMLRYCRVALEAGFPEEALTQVLRVYSDALGRVADSESQLFHFYVHQRLKAAGLAGLELVDSIQAAGERINPLMEPAILYFHRKAMTRAAREDMVRDLEEEAGLLAEGEVPGQLQAAIVFVDLSSFTSLAEAMGDVKAAEVLARFSNLVRDAVSRWEGRVVKQIGDAFMLVFPDPRSAVACALEVEGRASKEAQFPAARSGVHWGPVLFREGDYVGSNVNIASRLATEAKRHQVLVTGAVRNAAKDLADVEFVRLGKRRLKGLADEIVLFEVKPSSAEDEEKAIDPVCGMELRPAEVAARLSLEGRERAFCSDECLRQFVASPEKYS
jgi:class 3 adenylate cyclase